MSAQGWALTTLGERRRQKSFRNPERVATRFVARKARDRKRETLTTGKPSALVTYFSKRDEWW
jgi:hypothetical protein